jgi:hypothetical protein
MFVTLLLVTFAVAVSCSFAVAKIFDRSIKAILSRIVTDGIAQSDHRGPGQGGSR